MPQLSILIDKFLRRSSMSDAEKASLRNDLSVINADRANVNFAVPGPYTNDADAYANGVGYGEMYRKPDGSLSWNLGDPDAQLYIAAVEVALGTTIELALPSATNPRKIISDFYKAEKDAGRYSLHKRIYLPIYNNLAANAVDAITAMSGTFAGTVTLAQGYVQSDGTTGYFDTVTPWQSLVALDNATIGTLNYTQGTSVNMQTMGIGILLASSIAVGTENSPQVARAAWAGANALLVNDPVNLTKGIHMASRFGGVTRITRRLSSGILEATNSAATTAIVANGPLFMMARNNGSGSPAQITTAQIGAGFISGGMGSTDLAGYSLNLKTLWENLTGLTLP